MNSTSSVASRLQPFQRQQIAVKVLSQQEPIAQIAQEEQVSRKGGLPTKSYCATSVR